MVNKANKGDRIRLTVTLGEGQRAALEAIANQNGTTLAFVVRYALRRFIEEHGEDRLTLRFPSEALKAGQVKLRATV